MFVIVILIEFILLLLIINIRINIRIYNKEVIKTIQKLNFNNSMIINKINIDYDNNFAIIRRNYSLNGLFGFYVAYIGCLNILINNGYIPILDLSSFPNIFNSFNPNNSKENPWEFFFRQPFEYKLKDVEKYGKNIKYIICNNPKNRPDTNIYKNKVILQFWHNLALKYIPLKSTIIKEAEKVRNKLFNKSKNVLGVLIRGTDYISNKPKGHPIQPDPNIVIKDIKGMDKKNKYDWIFLTTEDDKIRNKFILKIEKKLKYLKSEKNIEYNYNNSEYIALNKHIKGNINFIKIYLINVIIVSKCIDVICSRTAGSVGAFILSNGFRNFKVYFLGRYK